MTEVHFFRIRGRGEVCRLLVLASEDPNAKFIDEIDFSFKNNKNCLLGVLPFAVIDGKPIVQNSAVEAALARKFNMYGREEKEIRMIDMINAQMQDIRDQFTGALNSPNFATERPKFFKALPGLLAKLEKLLKLAREEQGAAAYEKSASNFVLGGNRPSYADLKLFAVLDIALECGRAFNHDEGVLSLKDAPLAASAMRAVQNFPPIKAYINSPTRPKSVNCPKGYWGFYAEDCKAFTGADIEKVKKEKRRQFWRRPDVAGTVGFVAGALVSLVGLLCWGTHLVKQENRLLTMAKLK